MKLTFFCLLLLSMAVTGQEKNVLSATRIFAKADKVPELEKALAAHAQHYHTGDWKWRIFEIMSGPDAGGYQINEGPNNWATLDKRADLGAAHTADWGKTVGSLITEAGSSSFAVYNAELSTVQLTDYSDKIMISRMFPKPGMLNAVEDMVKKLKKVWQATGETVAVYTATASGPPQFILVTRMKTGLREMDPSVMKPLPERFDATYGAGSWQSYLADYAKNVDSRWSELLAYRADLSSK